MRASSERINVKSVIVFDATGRFCDRFIAKYGDRTRDQMILLEAGGLRERMTRVRLDHRSRPRGPSS